MENKIRITKIRMSIKLNPEIMKWVRQEAKVKPKSMASIVVGSMKDYKAAHEHDEQLSVVPKGLDQ
jgi:hypothetical protein